MHALLLIPSLFAASPQDIRSIEIVWQTAQDAYPAQGPAFVRSDDDVTVSLLIQFLDGSCASREGTWQDTAGVDHLCDRDLEELRDDRVEWFLVEPAQWRVVRDARGVGPAVPFINRPWARSTPDRGLLVEGPPCPGFSDDTACGTLHLAARLEGPAGETLAFTPDATEPARAFSVHIRTDDAPVGVAHELASVPHADVPRGAPPASHEAELGLAVDGNALAAHMARRMGLHVAFAGWDALVPAMTRVDLSKSSVMPGDVLHSGSWTGVLREDVGKRGALDPADTVLSVDTGPLSIKRVGDFEPGTRIEVWRFSALPARLPARRPRTTTRRKLIDVRPDAGVR